VPDPSNIIPKGVLIRRPHDTFFSIAMMTAKINIQPTLPKPTINIRSINAQQQPTQKTPLSMPSRKACHLY